jgi:hypothetical protein
VPHARPQPRIDTIVKDPASGAERRRSDYAGSVWFTRGGKTGGDIQEEARFFLPDSLPYWRARLGDAAASCSVALQVQSGQPNSVLDPHVDWVDDPRDDDLSWLEISFAVDGRDPLVVSYRVVALCDPTAVAQSR